MSIKWGIGHFVSVAALVTNEIGEVLLIRSPNRGWEYPGGMVEPGESLGRALCREIKEETGVDVAIKSFAGICKNIQRDVVNIDFICEYIDGEIKIGEESLEVKWVSREDARNMVTFLLQRNIWKICWIIQEKCIVLHFRENRLRLWKMIGFKWQRIRWVYLQKDS